MPVFLSYKLYSAILLSILISSPIMGQSEYKIFGHRGCRGIYPENTIEGFKKAIAFGVDGIELDVVVNKNQIVQIRSTSPGRGNRSTAWKNVCLAAKLPKRGRFFSFVTSCIIGWWIHGPEARKCSPNVDACAEFKYCSKIERRKST